MRKLKSNSATAANLAANLRYIRDRRNLTQQQLAKLCGLASHAVTDEGRAARAGACCVRGEKKSRRAVQAIVRTAAFVFSGFRANARLLLFPQRRPGFVWSGGTPSSHAIAAAPPHRSRRGRGSRVGGGVAGEFVRAQLRSHGPRARPAQRARLLARGEYV